MKIDSVSNSNLNIVMNPRIMAAQEPPINIDKQASSPLEELEDIVANKIKNEVLPSFQLGETPSTNPLKVLQTKQVSSVSPEH